MSDITDFGPSPYVVNIQALATTNDLFRVTKWTGPNMQLTLMSIPPGQDIGLEVHIDHDQFLRIEEGTATVLMGPSKTDVEQEWEIGEDWAVMVPAGSWHNVINNGEAPLKLYSLYAPAEHRPGTVHVDKAAAEAAEAN